MTEVLVAIPRVHEATRAGLERLRGAGCELVFNPHGRTLGEDELIAMLPGCFATIAGGERYGERVFAAAPDLRVVARMGSATTRSTSPPPPATGSRWRWASAPTTRRSPTWRSR